MIVGAGRRLRVRRRRGRGSPARSSAAPRGPHGLRAGPTRWPTTTGTCKYPDIDLGDQMTQLMMAQRGYQANLPSSSAPRDLPGRPAAREGLTMTSPISGIRPGRRAPVGGAGGVTGTAGAAGAAAARRGRRSGFASVLASTLDQLQATQAHADPWRRRPPPATCKDVHDYMIASNEASLATEMVVTLKNQAVERLQRDHEDAGLMPPCLAGPLARPRSVLSTISLGQKVVIGLLALGLLLGGFFFFRWITAPTYAPLFSNLASADASAIVDELERRGRLLPAGRRRGDDHGAQGRRSTTCGSTMSGKGLPAGQDTGYALLDQQGITTSEFQQQVDLPARRRGRAGQDPRGDPRRQRRAVVHVALPKDDGLRRRPGQADRVGAARPLRRHQALRRADPGGDQPGLLQHRGHDPDRRHRRRLHRRGALRRGHRGHRRRRDARVADGDRLRGPAGGQRAADPRPRRRARATPSSRVRADLDLDQPSRPRRPTPTTRAPRRSRRAPRSEKYTGTRQRRRRRPRQPGEHGTRPRRRRRQLHATTRRSTTQDNAVDKTTTDDAGRTRAASSG